MGNGLRLTSQNSLGHTSPMRRRAFLHAGFALLLAFAQADAAAHVVSHLVDAGTGSSQPDKHLPHSQVCQKCLAFASIGGAMPPAPLVTGEWVVTVLDATYKSVTPPAEPHQAYASRAPPADLV
jgi:hypothetical protein